MCCGSFFSDDAVSGAGHRGRPGRVGPVAVHARHRARRAHLRDEARRPGRPPGGRVGRAAGRTCSARFEAAGGTVRCDAAGRRDPVRGRAGARRRAGRRHPDRGAASSCRRAIPARRSSGWLRNPPRPRPSRSWPRWRRHRAPRRLRVQARCRRGRRARVPPGRRRARGARSATTRSCPPRSCRPRSAEPSTAPTGTWPRGGSPSGRCSSPTCPSVARPDDAGAAARRRPRVQPRGALHALRRWTAAGPARASRERWLEALRRAAGPAWLPRRRAPVAGHDTRQLRGRVPPAAGLRHQLRGRSAGRPAGRPARADPVRDAGAGPLPHRRGHVPRRRRVGASGRNTARVILGT